MSDHVGPTHEEALDQLAAVAASTSQSHRATSASNGRNALFAAALGLLVGGLSLTVGLTVHSSWAGLIAGIVGYTVLLQAIMAWRDRTKAVTGLGWRRRVNGAFAATMTLYLAGVLLAAFEVLAARPVIWVPYALVTALPMLACSWALAQSRR